MSRYRGWSRGDVAPHLNKLSERDTGLPREQASGDDQHIAPTVLGFTAVNQSNANDTSPTEILNSAKELETPAQHGKRKHTLLITPPTTVKKNKRQARPSKNAAKPQRTKARSRETMGVVLEEAPKESQDTAIHTATPDNTVSGAEVSILRQHRAPGIDNSEGFSAGAFNHGPGFLDDDMTDEQFSVSFFPEPDKTSYKQPAPIAPMAQLHASRCESKTAGQVSPKNACQVDVGFEDDGVDDLFSQFLHTNSDIVHDDESYESLVDTNTTLNQMPEEQSDKSQLRPANNRPTSSACVQDTCDTQFNQGKNSSDDTRASRQRLTPREESKKPNRDHESTCRNQSLPGNNISYPGQTSAVVDTSLYDSASLRESAQPSANASTGIVTSPIAVDDDFGDSFDELPELAEMIELAEQTTAYNSSFHFVHGESSPKTPKRLQWNKPKMYTPSKKRPTTDAPSSSSASLVPATPQHATTSSRSRNALSASSPIRIPESSPFVGSASGGHHKPFVRPDLPSPVRDRSPIAGISSSSRLFTHFRLGAAFNQAISNFRSSQNSRILIELFARVTKSYRDGPRQHFEFADLFRPDKPPTLSGTWVGWKGFEYWEQDGEAFLGSEGKERMCRVVGHLERAEVGRNFRICVLSIWEAEWDDVQTVREVICA